MPAGLQKEVKIAPRVMANFHEWINSTTIREMIYKAELV